MKTLNTETESYIDISILDNEFFVAVLREILAYKKNEVRNGLPKN